MFKKGTLSWDGSGNKEEGEDPVTRPQQVAAAMQLMVFGDRQHLDNQASKSYELKLFR